MKSYRLSLAARTDLRGIYRYTREAFGAAQAELYISGIKSACALLAASPGIGRTADSVLADLKRHEHAEHIIFFIDRQSDLLIIRILGRQQHWQRHLS